MATQIHQLKLFISCTSELATERELVETAINDLNADLTSDYGVLIKTLSWPKDFRPGVNVDGQSEINRQLGNDIDIYIGLLGSRFGTPTPRASSGTEEEFLLAYERFVQSSASIRVMFYFKTSSINIDAIDIDQLNLVRQFTKKLEALGGYYKKFQSPEDFQRMIAKDLKDLIRNEWKNGVWEQIDLSPSHATTTSDNHPLPANDDIPDNRKLGILDLYILVEDNSSSGRESLENIATTINSFVEELTAHTAQIQSTDLSTLNASQRKALIDPIDSTFRTTASRIQSEVASYHESMGAVFKAYFSILPLLDRNDKEEIRKLYDQIKSFREQNQEGKAGVSQFKQSISSIPAPTSSFGASKDSLFDSLGKLEAEIITSETQSELLLKEIAGLL